MMLRPLSPEVKQTVMINLPPFSNITSEQLSLTIFIDNLSVRHNSNCEYGGYKPFKQSGMLYISGWVHFRRLDCHFRVFPWICVVSDLFNFITQCSWSLVWSD